MVEFVEVIAKATGRRESVPADWLDSPVLAAQFELAPSPGEASDAPTEKNTVAEIEAYAGEHGIDLAGASTKAEKVAAIQAALPAPPEEEAPANPEVQTAYGQASTESPYPAVAAAQAAASAGTDATEASDETPAAGETEN
jgi:hypothetical protein